MFIDTHAHLYSEEFKPDLEEILNKALEKKIQKIYMPNIDQSSIEPMLEIEQKYADQCIATMGLHPCYVKKDFEKELYIIENWLSKRKFKAIGEIGIDLYWDKSLLNLQEEALKIQVKWANTCTIPIILHCRDSFRETIEIVKKYKSESLTGVFHCFSGSLEDAKEIIDIGFKLGIGGVSTFKNGGIDKVIPDLPLSALILETDAPYLAPVPYRGKRNEPSYIPIIAEKIASLKNCSVEEVAIQTTENATRLFN